MGNKPLKFFAVGNHSFTGIVNHTAQDLRPGKNSGSRLGSVASESLESLSLAY
ncbi:hypothetical protein MESS4_830170 [Mesorhizobium sp. STM 4661]|nr:hypothetical protein MESS4_830170 [Mesorhizobium sp. STM 4661]